MNEYKPLGVDAAINMLSELFGRPYIVPVDERAKQLLGSYNATIPQEDVYDRLSQFGTPVFGTFWAVPDDLPYLVYGKNDKLVEREFAKFEFPVASIVDFSRPKYIKKESAIGGKGSVKEIMGAGDWEVNIRGILCDDTSRVAQQKARQQQYAIDKLNEIAGAIKLAGRIFEERNISHIVIESVRFSAVQGKPGLIQYEIEAISDEGFLLTAL